jgi:hypothetical protein
MRSGEKPGLLDSRYQDFIDLLPNFTRFDVIRLTPTRTVLKGGVSVVRECLNAMLYGKYSSLLLLSGRASAPSLARTGRRAIDM